MDIDYKPLIYSLKEDYVDNQFVEEVLDDAFVYKSVIDDLKQVDLHLDFHINNSLLLKLDE
ncbi:MAG: hypothetical protein ACLR43_02300 [Faecalibacillus faecis]